MRAKLALFTGEVSPALSARRRVVPLTEALEGGGKQGIRGGCRGEQLPCGPHYFPAVNFARTISHPCAVDWVEDCFVVETGKKRWGEGESLIQQCSSLDRLKKGGVRRKTRTKRGLSSSQVAVCESDPGVLLSADDDLFCV